MMKRNVSVLLCLVLILAMAGCSHTGSSSRLIGNQPAGAKEVLQQRMDETNVIGNNSSQSTENGDLSNQQNKENEEPTDPEPSSEPDSTSKPEDDPDIVDVDLTVLSSTLVYAEVYNMMASPEEYIGKTVKMNGLFAYYHDEATDTYYFACVIQDATACCAQGIEFVLTDDYSYPADYPEVDAEICVIGVFDTYQEGEYTYCTLKNAKLL